MPLTDKLIKEICEYKVFCQQYFGQIGTYVFTTDRNTQLTADAVKPLFKRIKQAMAFKDEIRISPHSFRHTFAVRCIQSGMDAFTLQRLLRHTDLNMTNRYIRMFGSALKEQNDKYNPLNSIKLE